VSRAPSQAFHTTAANAPNIEANRVYQFVRITKHA